MSSALPTPHWHHEPDCVPQPREGLRCTSETDGVEVPGLTLIEEFVGEQEEEALLEHFVQGDEARWTGPLRRRVQHYG